MRVTPQLGGSLQIQDPKQTSGFDMGNRTLFIKTNGIGDVNQIFFAKGSHAGSWKLQLLVNGERVDFQTSNAIGRLWQLEAITEFYKIDLLVFLEEKMPVVFEKIEITSLSELPLAVEAALEIDISALPAPKGKFRDIAAKFIPRLSLFSSLWSIGWGRWLQIPSPKKLNQIGKASLTATGKTAWSFAANEPFQSCTIKSKTAQLLFSIKVPGNKTKTLEFCLAEAGELSASDVLRQSSAALKNAREYADWLASQIDIADPLLRSLYVAGLNAARSMYKEFPGGFSGLVAGPDYAFPPRIYFRDGYWTAQALIDTDPDLVRAHLLHLAAGVHPDGQCPSGIFAAHLLKEWHAPANCNADWLPDHFDSPSFFILLLNDYLQSTQDWGLLAEIPQAINPRNGWPARTIAEIAASVIHYLVHLDQDGDGLIEKPYAANDWADNINRSTWVTYDQVLYVAALRAYAILCPHCDRKDQADHYRELADQALGAMNRELWDDELGYFVNYRRAEFTEKNLSVDTLVTLYYHLLDEPRSKSLCRAVEHLLSACNNKTQPYGDYGLLCAYPLYSNPADLFDKSALPYCYHNGADWPYWNGMVAAILLERHDPAGLEMLTNWWRYSLEKGWLTPVEYYSPPYPVGGMLQGWSSLPAAVLLRQLKTVKELLHAQE